MKKFVLSVTLWGLFFGMFYPSWVSAAWPEPDSTPYRSIWLRQENGNLSDTGLFALIGRHETMVPVTIITDFVKLNFAAEAGNGFIYFNIAAPAFDLETPRLTEFVRNGVDFRLKTTVIEGLPYINIRGLEKMLNVSLDSIPGKPGILIHGQTALPQDRKLHSLRSPAKNGNRLSLVWDHITGASPDLAQEEKIPGLSVISPTWFAVTDGRGTVASRAEWKYVQDAHDKGYKVWPLISNSFDPDMTKTFLADEASQDRAIRQMLVFTALYDLDGINIDFENIYDDDRDRLTAFVGRLAARLKEQNVTVSIDTTVPSGTPMWSTCYDRAALAQLVDYFIVMTYDEHWRTSPVAGSVASIGWVEQGIVNTLQYVPKEKLLMGVPFYTREWRETDVGYGNVRVRASTMWMSDVEERIFQYGLVPQWMNDAGQYYVEYAKDGSRYRIWMEESKSLGLKVDLVKKYDLAGVAAWRKGFEKSGIWEGIQLALSPKSREIKPVSSEMDIANWSLKSFMEKLKGAAAKGIKE